MKVRFTNTTHVENGRLCNANTRRAKIKKGAYVKIENESDDNHFFRSQRNNFDVMTSLQYYLEY